MAYHMLNTTVARKAGLREVVEGARVGLEVECEGTRLPPALMSYYNVHEDHSLRNFRGEHPPREYVFKKPLPFIAATKAIHYLDRKIKAAGCELFTDSPRTSVHVHVNVSDMPLREVFNMAMLYSIYEEQLVDWCGPTRVANLFCLRGCDTDYNIDGIVSAINGRPIRECFHNDRRYTAMNMASLSKFGTIEFRALRGTTDPDTISSWVGTLLNFREMATSGAVGRNPLEIYQTFRAGGPLPFHRSVQNSSKYPTIPPMNSLVPDTSSMIRGLHLFGPIVGAADWASVGADVAPVFNQEGVGDFAIHAPGLTRRQRDVLAAETKLAFNTVGAGSTVRLTGVSAEVIFRGRRYNRPTYTNTSGRWAFTDAHESVINFEIAEGGFIVYVADGPIYRIIATDPTTAEDIPDSYFFSPEVLGPA